MTTTRRNYLQNIITANATVQNPEVVDELTVEKYALVRCTSDGETWLSLWATYREAVECAERSFYGLQPVALYDLDSGERFRFKTRLEVERG